jgi:hypothetical protein
MQFYDRGLLFQDGIGNIKFLNLLAKVVLLRYYLRRFKMERILDFRVDLQGKYLEKYCVNSDLASGTIVVSMQTSIELFRSGSPDGPKTRLRDRVVNGFYYLEDLEIGDGKKWYGSVLLLTKDLLFPYTDYVIYTPADDPESRATVIFKRISMSTIPSRMMTPRDEFTEWYMKEFPDINESVGEVMKFLLLKKYRWDHGMKQEQKEDGKSVCRIILEILFGKIERFEVKINDGVLTVLLDEIPVDVEIVYVTGTKMEANQEIWKIPLKNIVCCFQEDLKRLKIPF